MYHVSLGRAEPLSFAANPGGCPAAADDLETASDDLETGGELAVGNHRQTDGASDV
jgi:hypothetical protein